MPSDRFFINSPLDTPEVRLEGNEFHHLAHVMRLHPGQTLQLVNGRGSLAQAKLTTLHPNFAEITLLSHRTASPPLHSLILALGLTRPSTLEWTLEKATELGATHIFPFLADRSEKHSSPRLPRLQTLLITALKQCGRLFIPTLEIRPPLRDWPSPSGQLFFGDLSPDAPRLHPPLSTSVTFFIGPEKGFSPTELEILTQKFQAKGISLHENTLRAETAALAALSQYYTVSG